MKPLQNPLNLALMADQTPTIFTTTKIAPEDPLWQRPWSDLSFDAIVEAARMIHAFPAEPEIQRYAPLVVSHRLTREEFAALQQLCRQAAVRN
jgi:hypothetical protein